jgi:hypothetical protein
MQQVESSRELQTGTWARLFFVCVSALSCTLLVSLPGAEPGKDFPRTDRNSLKKSCFCDGPQRRRTNLQ